MRSPVFSTLLAQRPWTFCELVMRKASMPIRIVMILVLLLIAAVIVVGIVSSQSGNASGFVNSSVGGFP